MYILEKIPIKWRAILGGIKSYLPFNEYRGTGGTDSARYCYSVWLRHLSFLFRFKQTELPKTIAELGPGDSLGVDLAALISGVKKYYALDIVCHIDNRKNLQIFQELIFLFKAKADIPNEKDFPKLEPKLDSYKFPSHILDKNLSKSMDISRLKMIENELKCLEPNRSGLFIRYFYPWISIDIIKRESIDFLFSQAVLEHIDFLDKAYKAMYFWLKPNAYMSHVIDFKCHGLSDKWNGHWTYSDLTWKIIRGKRPFLINREPLSTHIALLKETGFKIIYMLPVKAKNTIKRSKLAKRFQNISEEDLTTSSVYILAQKV